MGWFDFLKVFFFSFFSSSPFLDSTPFPSLSSRPCPPPPPSEASVKSKGKYLFVSVKVLNVIGIRGNFAGNPHCGRSRRCRRRQRPDHRGCCSHPGWLRGGHHQRVCSGQASGRGRVLHRVRVRRSGACREQNGQAHRFVQEGSVLCHRAGQSDNPQHNMKRKNQKNPSIWG